MLVLHRPTSASASTSAFPAAFSSLTEIDEIKTILCLKKDDENIDWEKKQVWALTFTICNEGWKHYFWRYRKYWNKAASEKRQSGPYGFNQFSWLSFVIHKQMIPSWYDLVYWVVNFLSFQYIMALCHQRVFICCLKISLFDTAQNDQMTSKLYN